MTDVDIDDRAQCLLSAYHDLLRAQDVVVHPPEVVEQCGPLTRKSGGTSGFITYRSLNGLDGPELDTLIAQQRDYFAARGQAVEWKLHGYDAPADLPQRLRKAGFVPAESETVMVGQAWDLVLAPRPVEGVTIRHDAGREDLERLRDMQERVWGLDCSWMPDALESEMNADPPTIVVLAEAGDELVSACWMRSHPGTGFVSMWGGTTLPQWRGRGLYRQLVARRAQLALRDGYRYLQADCTADSAAILKRLGASAVAETVPYLWNPPE